MSKITRHRWKWTWRGWLPLFERNGFIHSPGFSWTGNCLSIVCRDTCHMYTFLSKLLWIHLQIQALPLILRLRVAPHRKKKLLTGVSNQMYRYNCLQARVFSKSPIRLPPLQEPPNAATLPAGPVALRHLRGIPSYADAVMLQGLLWKRVSRRKHLGKKRMNWLTLTSSSFWEKVYWWYLCIAANRAHVLFTQKLVTLYLKFLPQRPLSSPFAPVRLLSPPHPISCLDLKRHLVNSVLPLIPGAVKSTWSQLMPRVQWIWSSHEQRST